MAQSPQMPRTPNQMRAEEGLPALPRGLAQADRIVNAACPDVGEEPSFGALVDAATAEIAEAFRVPPPKDPTVYAFTPAGGYPPYLNIRRGDPGVYVITVRSPAGAAGDRCGDTATIAIGRDQLLELFKALAGELEVPVSRRL